MIRTNRLAENGEYKACECVLQIGHILGENAVPGELKNNSSKCRSNDQQQNTS